MPKPKISLVARATGRSLREVLEVDGFNPEGISMNTIGSGACAALIEERLIDERLQPASGAPGRYHVFIGASVRSHAAMSRATSAVTDRKRPVFGTGAGAVGAAALRGIRMPLVDSGSPPRGDVVC